MECLGEEGGCLDTGKGRECWEGAEAGLALRAWVLSEGGGERQEVSLMQGNVFLKTKTTILN